MPERSSTGCPGKATQAQSSARGSCAVRRGRGRAPAGGSRPYGHGAAPAAGMVTQMVRATAAPRRGRPAAPSRPAACGRPPASRARRPGRTPCRREGAPAPGRPYGRAHHGVADAGREPAGAVQRRPRHRGRDQPVLVGDRGSGVHGAAEELGDGAAAAAAGRAVAGGPQNRSPGAARPPGRRLPLPPAAVVRPLLGRAHAPGQPVARGRQLGAAGGRHQREHAAPAEQQQVDQGVLAQMMRQGMHGQLVWQ